MVLASVGCLRSPALTDLVERYGAELDARQGRLGVDNIRMPDKTSLLLIVPTIRAAPPSSSGLGLRILSPATGVRLP